jgi:hypothetical protein
MYWRDNSLVNPDQSSLTKNCEFEFDLESEWMLSIKSPSALFNELSAAYLAFRWSNPRIGRGWSPYRTQKRVQTEMRNEAVGPILGPMASGASWEPQIVPICGRKA